MCEYLFSHFDFSFVMLKNMIRCKEFIHKFKFTVAHGA